MTNPGQDQIAKWKAAVAAHHRAQRRQRYRPRTGTYNVTGAGMVRLPAERARNRTKPRGETS